MKFRIFRNPAQKEVTDPPEHGTEMQLLKWRKNRQGRIAHGSRFHKMAGMIFSLSCIFILCQIPVFGLDTRLTKSLERDFDVPEAVNLEISNKYGNIVIGTWDQPKISIRIEMIAHGKDTEDAEKLLGKVEFDFHQTRDYLVVESVFDRRSGFFKDLLSSLSDYSKTIISKNKLMVNYELMIPDKTASIVVNNKFGDIFIGSINARTKFTLGHGNLVAEDLEGYCELDMSYGKVKIKKLDECRVSLKAAEINVEQVGRMQLQSSNSQLFCADVHIIRGSSTNDQIEIGQVMNLDLDADFSEINLDRLSGKSRINQDYGALNVMYIGSDFADLHLVGRSTDYNLHVSDLAGFEALIIAKEDRLQIGGILNQLEKQYEDDRSKIVRLTGFLGKSDKQGSLYLEARGGAVSLDFVHSKVIGYNE
jgi:hypothetical protein